VLHNPDSLNTVTERIIGAAIAVHRTFGAGLLESIYRSCLVVELRAAGCTVKWNALCDWCIAASRSERGFASTSWSKTPSW
jgi:hypothetical protein